MDASFLERLRRGDDEAAAVAVIVAHPDDEVIGVGGRLPSLRGAHVVHVTDGAPADMRDAARLGFASREAYAAARVFEGEAALALAGIGPERLHRLGFADQGASLRMREVAGTLLAVLRRLRPAVVMTHPFENGHPDHDATALATHLACRSLEGPPLLLEFASYHDADGSGTLATQRFLPADVPVVEVALGEAERELKRRMAACHATQEAVLRRFPLDRELYRPAPAYDFLRPPHPWRPLYEAWFDTMTRERWQALAAEALGAGGLG